MCPCSWVCARPKVGQIKHPNTAAVPAQFCVPKWPENIRALEHRALQGLETAPLLRNVFFIMNVFCWGGCLFVVLVYVMSYEYMWQGQFLAQSLQLVQTGQRSLPGAQTHREPQVPLVLALVQLLGMMPSAHRACWMSLSSLTPCCSLGWLYGNKQGFFFFFPVEITIIYKYYCSISKCSLAIATFSTSPLAYLMARQTRLGMLAGGDQKGCPSLSQKGIYGRL